MLFGLLRDRLRPYRQWLGAVVVLQLIGTIASLYLPSLNADIIDNGVSHGDTGYILRTGAWMLLVSLVQISCSVVAVYFPLGATADGPHAQPQEGPRRPERLAEVLGLVALEHGVTAHCKGRGQRCSLERGRDRAAAERPGEASRTNDQGPDVRPAVRGARVVGEELLPEGLEVSVVGVHRAPSIRLLLARR